MTTLVNADIFLICDMMTSHDITSILVKMTNADFSYYSNIFQPKGLRAESARAVLADGNPTVGGGKTF